MIMVMKNMASAKQRIKTPSEGAVIPLPGQVFKNLNNNNLSKFTRYHFT